MDWSAKKVLYELEQRRNTNFAEIERAYGMRPATCSIACLRPLEHAEIAIAETLGEPAHIIWPSRYDDDGKRLKPQPRKNYKTKSNKKSSIKPNKRVVYRDCKEIPNKTATSNKQDGSFLENLHRQKAARG